MCLLHRLMIKGQGYPCQWLLRPYDLYIYQTLITDNTQRWTMMIAGLVLSECCKMSKSTAYIDSSVGDLSLGQLNFHRSELYSRLKSDVLHHSPLSLIWILDILVWTWWGIVNILWVFFWMKKITYYKTWNVGGFYIWRFCKYHNLAKI